MKDKISILISTIVVFLIIAVTSLLGYIIWDNIEGLNVATEPQETNQENVNFTVGETVDTQTIKTPKVLENNATLDYSPSENTSSNNYDNVNINKYFYNQLNDTSKTIYKAFASKKENMKSGTYKVDFGSAFSNILKGADGQDKLAQYYQSAIEAYTYDNPDVFYLSPNKLYLNIETTQKVTGNSYNVYIDNGTQPNYLIDEFSNENEVNSALQQINDVRDSLVSRKTGNDYKDIKMVHDYIVENTEYDTTISKPNIYNMYGALINKSAVCEGYARAFKYIMDGMGIDCVLVIGQGTNSTGQTENHAWNYVKLNNTWYAIDCTWDDPVVVGGGKATQSSKYRYFLVGSETMSKDHTPNGQFTENGKVFNYPDLSSQDY